MHAKRISKELGLNEAQVAATLKLLESGATLPFIARYRKEMTSGLDEVQIRAIEERHQYLCELEERRQAILRLIDGQKKLTPTLKARIEACETKVELEDLYLPFKVTRKSKASVAREKGLLPLAEQILAQPSSGNLRKSAAMFVDQDKDVGNVEEAIDGARDIVIESVALNPKVRAHQRNVLARFGVLHVKAKKAAKEKRTKFEGYYDFDGRLDGLPSHRALAILRGESEGVLQASLKVDDDRSLSQIERLMNVRHHSPFAKELRECISLAYKKRLLPTLSKQVRDDARKKAEFEAIRIFADNLESLLLSAPYGERAVVAIDPGIRTGCKCVALSSTGVFLENITIFPMGSADQKARAERELVAFVRKHKPDGIAIGDGTGGRETESMTRAAMKAASLDVDIISVSEAGASIYSASDLAREEHPDLDLTVRGAISIGRRLQDPLAELVKLDPKSIGVGQYQHDVDQSLLASKLGDVVESCVNRIGVDLNTASASLLSYVAGIGPKLAKNIVEYRNQYGRVKSRKSLLKVKGLGPKAYEQAAGFLRVRDGKEPLDASGVHPERYKLVERIAKEAKLDVRDLLGENGKAADINIRQYVEDGIGDMTLRGVIDELQKGDRDPRDKFESAQFDDNVHEISDLREGMILEGLVTNVTAFGAFVNIGVHQDGLVHISELANRFIRDPSEEVQVGQKVKVCVLSVDHELKRIALSRKRTM